MDRAAPRPQNLPHSSGSGLACRGQRVTVDVSGHLDGRVAEDLAHDLQWDSGGQH